MEIAKVEGRLEVKYANMETKFANVETKIETRFAVMDARLAAMETTFARLELLIKVLIGLSLFAIASFSPAATELFRLLK